MYSSNLIFIYLGILGLGVLYYYILAMGYVIKNKKWIHLFMVEVALLIICILAYYHFIISGEAYNYLVPIFLSFYAIVGFTIILIISILIGLIHYLINKNKARF